MADVTYREFDNAQYSKLRRDLLRNKGGGLQEDLLHAVRDSGRFLEFMEPIRLHGSRKVVLCPYPLTAAEYRNPPVDTQMMLYEVWETLTPRTACRSAFWANVTCSHIRDGRMESVYLAASGGSVDGAERIDRAIAETGDTRSKRMDDCVRTVLRRLGGLPEARGNRTVYVDCPLARTWWREHFVIQAGHHDTELQAKIRDVLRLNKAYWEQLVVMVVSRNSVMGSQEIRNALIVRLAEAIRLGDNPRVTTAKGLVRGCRNLSALQAGRELSVLDATELAEVIDGVISAI